MSGPTDSQLIEAYIARRDKLAAMAEDFKAECQPFKDQMDTIEAEMNRRLIERGADNTSTEAGSAFHVRNMKVKCTDKIVLLKWAFENFDTYGKDLLAANVSKETLTLYINKSKNEQHPDGLVPPGLSVSYDTAVQFRKA